MPTPALHRQGGAAISGVNDVDATGPDSAAVIEKEQLEGLLQVAGPAGVRDILEAFWRSTDELFHSIAQDIRLGQYEDAARGAHALKGSAANVGALLLTATARALESGCRERDVAALQTALSGAPSAVEKTKTAFDDRLADAG